MKLSRGIALTGAKVYKFLSDSHEPEQHGQRGLLTKGKANVISVYITDPSDRPYRQPWHTRDLHANSAMGKSPEGLPHVHNLYENVRALKVYLPMQPPLA